MKSIFFKLLLLSGSYAACLQSCSTEFDVFAPEEELYAVFCILNPTESVQFVKISQVFQYEGDVIAYAGQNDPSAKGFELSLSGKGKTYIATPDTINRDEDGIWTPNQTIYRFDTQGNDSLVPGGEYSLEIRKKEDSEFLISAQTKIPLKPFLKTFPGPFLIDETDYSFPTVDLNEEIWVYFLRNGGAGFEIRAMVEFFADGQSKAAQFGPSKVFSAGVGCAADNPNEPELCYVIPPRAILGAFNHQVEMTDGLISYVDSPKVATQAALLNRSCRLEVTALDSSLTLFLSSSDFFGFGLNLLIDKKEFSNISGGNYGIFGAINQTHNYFYLSTCSKYLLGFIDPEFPPSDCEW